MIVSKIASNQSHQSQYFERRCSIFLKKDCVWQINSGVVRTSTVLENGTIVSLGLWGKGDIVSSILSKSEPYQVECLSEVRATLIPLNQYPKIEEALIDRIQQLQEFMQILYARPVEVSVFKFLSWVAKKFGRQTDRGQLIELHLTHQEIAEILGITRVTVTRSLKQLEKGDAIKRFDRSSILVQEEHPFWYYEI
jgi:CRP-like cAMP-binding protein